MTPEELIKQLNEKLSKCAFCMGVYSGTLFQIVSDMPLGREFDAIEDRLRKLLNAMKEDIEMLYYEDKKCSTTNFQSTKP